MAVGQGALRGGWDIAALDAAETRLEVLAVEQCCAHAKVLRTVMELHELHLTADAGLSTVPQLALLLQMSEGAARALLAEARLLVSLPGGLEAVECGLLTVPQSAALLRAVGESDDAVRLVVWRRLQARLLAALDEGSVLTPARLAPLLARWVIATDPVSAESRRKQAEAGGEVSYRRRADGLGDLFATAIPGPVLQAVLCRIRQAARPFGAADERSAGKRRLDALINLILGREQLHLDADPPAAGAEGGDPAGARDLDTEGAGVGGGCRSGAAPGSGSSCGCRLDSPVPCGAQVVVHVPLGAALGTTDELAELVGHGPLHPDQLHALLRNAPQLQAVHVDAKGVPVSVDDQIHRPPRDDDAALRAALLTIAGSPPGPHQPRHPHDHPPPRTGPPDEPDGPRVDRERGGPDGDDDGGGSVRDAAAVGDAAGDAAGGGVDAVVNGGVDAGTPPLDGSAGHPHPPDTPGAYRPPRWLRRLVQLRAPRCEWPACGARSELCDVEHDDAWPAGPTCPCNGGPLCRRHHRVKQQLMRKTRDRTGAVRWTDPTGRTWTSPPQHPRPARPVRPLPPLPVAAPHHLSPEALLELLMAPDDDPIRFELRTPDTDPDTPDQDRLGQRLEQDTSWGLALDDPCTWST